MTPTPQPAADRVRRRRLVVIAVIVIAVIVVAGLVAGWLFFFGSEAPPAPTLDDALQILLPSPSPA